jgi:hypothetical protein
LQLVRFLLDHGADPNVLETRPEQINRRKLHSDRINEFSLRISPSYDTRGFTALHYAVVMGNEEIVKLLYAKRIVRFQFMVRIDHGADPTIKTVNGHTAEAYFDESEQPESLLELLKKGQADFLARKRRAEKELRRKCMSHELFRERLYCICIIRAEKSITLKKFADILFRKLLYFIHYIKIRWNKNCKKQLSANWALSTASLRLYVAKKMVGPTKIVLWYSSFSVPRVLAKQSWPNNWQSIKVQTPNLFVLT